MTLVERRAEWVTTELRSGDRVAIADPATSFAVDELYARITLDPS